MLRENDRQLRRVNRDVDRDRTKLEREEKKLEMEIKKAAKAGNKSACTVLAKQLVQLRKQKQRTLVASSQITAAGYTAKAMGANVKIAEAMGETTKTMGKMNKVMDPQKVAGTMRDFAMANERMNMTEETSEINESITLRIWLVIYYFHAVNDALDDILAESGDEEEEAAIVNQVLDEIGIEISGKVCRTLFAIVR